MFARSAPCAIAIRRPSPVLFGGDTAPRIGPRRIGLDQSRVPFEPAGGQHDAAAGSHAEILASLAGFARRR